MAKMRRATEEEKKAYWAKRKSDAHSHLPRGLAHGMDVLASVVSSARAERPHPWPSGMKIRVSETPVKKCVGCGRKIRKWAIGLGDAQGWWHVTCMIFDETGKKRGSA